MKKVSLFISALLISMSSMAQMYLWQGGHYTAANLDSITFSLYPGTDNLPQVAPTPGKYTIVWNAVDYSECNDLVFAGNYNNYNITDVAAMAKFEKIAGYTNWYKAVITPTEPIDQLEGKPCALAADGTFPTSWDHQWIGSEEKPCKILKGDAELLIEYSTETKLIVKQIGSVVYVRSYQFKVDPCIVEPVYDVTFNLTTAQAMPANAAVHVVGDFKENAWTADAYPMKRIDNTHFTATIKSKMGREYKYVANGSWEYEMMDFPAGDRNCSETVGNLQITDVTMTDYVYGFLNINATYCEREVTDITITPASYTFAEGDDPIRLSYTLTPIYAEATIEWASSNENVATVDNQGNVTPLNIGEATITATVQGTDIKGTCQVFVKPLAETLKFTEAYIGLTDVDTVNTVVYEHSTLGNVNVHIATGRVQLFTEGLYFNNSGKLDGAERGGYIYITTPIALAYADKNKDNPNMARYPNGVSFSLGSYAIDLEPTDSATWHHAHKGYADNQVFMGYMNTWLEDFNKEGKFTEGNYQDFAMAGIYGFGGTKLTLYEYTLDEDGTGSYESYPNWLWGYTPNGIVTGGELYISGQDGSSKYMTKIDYMNVNVKFVATDTVGIPGVYSVVEDGKYVIKSTGVEFGEERNYVTGTKPEEAPAKAKKNGGINIFVDHIIPRVSELPAMNTKSIVLPKEANLLSIKK